MSPALAVPVVAAGDAAGIVVDGGTASRFVDGSDFAQLINSRADTTKNVRRIGFDVWFFMNLGKPFWANWRDEKARQSYSSPWSVVSGQWSVVNGISGGSTLLKLSH